MSLQPGAVFAGFTIERELGAGGMGVVYLARHPRLPRRVALKLLRTDLGSDPSFVGRFRREADTVAQLDHPNIVPIDDCGADEGQLWLSMRYISGTTADKALAEYGQGMPPERAVLIVEKVAAALDFAHRRQIIHRDVKPANILLTEGSDDEPEQVFLSDFGVAKAFGEIESQSAALTAAGGVVATIDYAAPEQIEGRPLDGRCDVYALGCVLYKLLVGTVPYPGESLAAKVYARLHLPPPLPSRSAPSVPAGFDAVVAKALARDRTARYPTCRSLAAGARAALATHSGETAPTERVGPDTDATEFVRRTTSPSNVPSTPSPTVFAVDPAAAPPVAAGARSGHTAGSPRGSGSPGGASGGPPGGGSGGPPGGGSGDTSGERLPGGLEDLLRRRPDGESAATARKAVRRRSLLAVGAVLLVGVIVVTAAILIRSNRISGSAATGSDSSTRAASSSGTVSSGTVSSGTVSSSAVSTTGTAPVSSASNSTSAHTTGGTVASPGAVLPVSAALSNDILIVSGQVDGKFALYPVAVSKDEVADPLIPPVDGGQNPVISPDRRSIIYLQAKGTATTLRVAAASGGSDRLLFANPAGCTSVNRPAWNPADRTELALACVRSDKKTALMLIDMQGRVRRTIDTGLSTVDDLSFAPDGLRLAYWGSPNVGAGAGSIYVQHLDTAAPPTAITTAAGGGDNDPDWSPSSDKIVFHRTPGQIMVVDADGSNLHRVFSDATSQGPVWSPQGDRIAFKTQVDADGGRVWTIRVIDADGSNEETLTVGVGASVVGSPAWGTR